MSDVIVKGGIRYEIGTYESSKDDDYTAFIRAYDAREYADGDHRPFGESGFMSCVNYTTIEKAREVFEGLKI